MRLSLPFQRRSGRTRVCGDCSYFDETASYCKKLWAPVVSTTHACKFFKPRPGKEVVGSEHG